MASIADILMQTMLLDPAADAVEHDAAWWHWGDLDHVQRAIARHFEEAGAGAGARIGILFRSRPAHVAALIACVVNGRCAVAFNTLLPPDRLIDDLRTQNVAMLLGEKEDLARPEIRVVAAETALPTVAFSRSFDTDVEWIGDARQSTPSSLATRRGDTLVEMLTSGTTGTPKRVPLGMANFAESLRGANAYERNRREGDLPSLRSGVRIITAPLTHISGISGVLLSLAGGRKVCLLEKFAVDSFVSAVQRHKAKVVNAPPAALRMLLDADVPAEALSSLVAVRAGTAALDPATVDAYMERYNLPVLAQYGATEFAGSVAGWSIDDFRANFARKRGSVGRFQPNVHGRIVDPETGAVAGTDEAGILELKGPQVSAGDDWVRTTDRARIDAEGFLFILGRADHAINRGGFKIHPDEVARALQGHPAIREAVVIGLPDRRLGEVPVAMATVWPEQAVPAGEDVIAFLKDRLLPYQLPVAILFERDLPRTPLLKPSMPEVRRLLEERFAENAAS